MDTQKRLCTLADVAEPTAPANPIAVVKTDSDPSSAPNTATVRKTNLKAAATKAPPPAAAAVPHAQRTQ